MKAGFIGLGKMGLNMVRRLIQNGHEIIAFDVNADAVKKAEEYGATGVTSLQDMKELLPAPRIIWVMVPAGNITEKTVFQVMDRMDKNDIIIDGGNSNYRDSLRRGKLLKEKNIFFLDAGTSGGIWGLKEGYCLMIGGGKKPFESAEPLFKTLAPEKGYLHVGPSGSGHFVKMIHNGIEYAMLQAYGEGFEILHAKKEFNLDLNKISTLWNQGSVIRSWLLELAELAFSENPQLDGIKDYVEDSGEGRWTVETALELDVPAPSITISLMERFRSRQDESFRNKVIAALRNQFGGHKIQKI